MATKDNNYDIFEKLVLGARYVMDPEEFRDIIKTIGTDAAALDFETTGLKPRSARVRLSCIYHPEVGVCLIDHDYCGAFNKVAKDMLGPMWLVYNAKFEWRWFDYAGCPEVDIMDVDFLAKSKRGGGYSSLAYMAKRDLYIELDKEQQLSDWSLPELSATQLEYAAGDAAITWMLFDLWYKRLNKGQLKGASIFQDAVPATVECEETGMILDTDVHLQNIDTWKMKQRTAFAVVRRYMKPSAVANPNSNIQVSNWLKTQLGESTIAMWPQTTKTKQLSLNRKQIAPIAAKSNYPFSRFLNAFILYKYYNKYLSTYGETLVTKQFLEDQITYRLNIGQAATGRYSSSAINIQNIPRAPWVRRVFLPPEGYSHLVVADYSGVEVRVLAELSGDKRLLHDCIYGDVHSGSASAIYGINEAEFIDVIKSEGDLHANIRPHYKELRSRAKGFTFQNVYGAGAAALSIVLKCTVPEAEDALRKWATRYPDAYNYRHVMFDHLMRSGYLPVCDGRTIFVPKAERSLPVASNYGIQGAAASVMLRAMYHVKFLRDTVATKQRIPLVATVHDEMLLACNEDDIDVAKNLLTEGMIRGWLDIFPDSNTENLVESKAGVNWGESK